TPRHRLSARGGGRLALLHAGAMDHRGRRGGGAGAPAANRGAATGPRRAARHLALLIRFPEEINMTGFTCVVARALALTALVVLVSGSPGSPQSLPTEKALPASLAAEAANAAIDSCQKPGHP